MSARKTRNRIKTLAPACLVLAALIGATLAWGQADPDEPAKNTSPEKTSSPSQSAKSASPESPSTPAPDGTPRPIQTADLVEQTTARLVQLDVSVTGPQDVLETLTPVDFDLVVGGREIEDYTLDRICPATPASSSGEDRAEKERSKSDESDDETTVRQATPGNPSVNYLFYFDQAFLTVEGRVRSLQIAEEFLEDLIDSNDRVTVVSSGQILKTFASLESDPTALRDAMKEISSDPQQWFPAYTSDEERMNEIARTLNDSRFGGVERAIGMARRFQADEAWITDRALRRLSMVVGRFADLPTPKATIYFADRMRSRAGEQYMQFFGASSRDNLDVSNMETRSQRAQHAFDKVVAEANAHGVRLYTIQAEGLVGNSITTEFNRGSVSTNRHIRMAQDSLKGFALETGGQAFINGIKTKKMVAEIRQDLECLFLISFSSRLVPKDRALPVLVRSNRSKVKARTRGQLFVQSEGERMTSRLMAAFGARDVVKQSMLRGNLIPIELEDGKYRALLQLHVEGSPLSGTKWDLGASVLSKGRVREDVSGRVEVSGAGAPVVLEAEITLSPGPFEIALVAVEEQSDAVYSGQVTGDWPRLRGEGYFIPEVAVIQPTRAAFVRDGEVRSSGALARDETELLATENPTALVALVCRGNLVGSAPLTVRRALVGDSSASFKPVKLKLDRAGCAQVRDLIPGGAMTDGSFTYEIRLMDGGEEKLVKQRKFSATAGARKEVQPASR